MLIIETDLRPNLATVCAYAGKRPPRPAAARPRPVGILAQLRDRRPS
jgi:hypothetical protein